MHFIERTMDFQPCRRLLNFGNGETRSLNLEANLKTMAALPESAYRPKLAPAVFCQARLEAGVRALCWDSLTTRVQPDGTEQLALVDWCPDALEGLGQPVLVIDSRTVQQT